MKALALRSAMKNIMQLRRTQRMSSMQELCKLLNKQLLKTGILKRQLLV